MWASHSVWYGKPYISDHVMWLDTSGDHEGLDPARRYSSEHGHVGSGDRQAARRDTDVDIVINCPSRTRPVRCAMKSNLIWARSNWIGAGDIESCKLSWITCFPQSYTCVVGLFYTVFDWWSMHHHLSAWGSSLIRQHITVFSQRNLIGWRR